MNKIKLRLTGVGSVLTKAAEKKLETEEDYQIPRCSNGLTEEQYLDMEVPLPKDLIEKLKNKDKGIELEDEDFKEVYSDVSLYNTDILFKITDDEEITTLFLRGSDITLTVLETCDQIDEYEEYMSLSSFEKAWIGFKIYFSNLFRRKNKIKEIID